MMNPSLVSLKEELKSPTLDLQEEVQQVKGLSLEFRFKYTLMFSF